jgi:hypothetical protein
MSRTISVLALNDGHVRRKMKNLLKRKRLFKKKLKFYSQCCMRDAIPVKSIVSGWLRLFVDTLFVSPGHLYARYCNINNCVLCWIVQKQNFFSCSGVHPASHPLHTAGYTLGIKRLGREADHSPPTVDVVKKMWIYAYAPPYDLMA